MPRNAGWVELVDCDTRVVVARGRLELSETPGKGVHHEWIGELTPMRFKAEIRPGTYRARFEDAADEVLVNLTRVGDGEPSVELHCTGECELPLTLKDLGGE